MHSAWEVGGDTSHVKEALTKGYNLSKMMD